MVATGENSSYLQTLEAGIVGDQRSVSLRGIRALGGTKQSGLGRGGASAGMLEFQETRYVAWKA